MAILPYLLRFFSSALKPLNVLYTDAVRMNHVGITNKVVEDKIKLWLRQARDRDGGRKLRCIAAEKRSRSNSAVAHTPFNELETDEADSSNTNVCD